MIGMPKASCLLQCSILATLPFSSSTRKGTPFHRTISEVMMRVPEPNVCQQSYATVNKALPLSERIR